MKIVLTGSNGQLGMALMNVLKKEDVLEIDTHNCDITIKNEVVSKIISFSPDVVLHCAAYTAVEQAEDDPEQCYKVNVEATENIAKACLETGAGLLYVSTDYVFTGEGEVPYEVNDETKPLSVYGKSKLQGEEMIKKLMTNFYIVRTSWLFGDGNNFVKTMLGVAENKNKLSIVSDQIGSPTYAVDLANTIYDIIRTEKYGMYHVTNEGFYSWADFAQLIFAKIKTFVEIDRVTSEAYQAKAERPKNSRLSKASLETNGFMRLPSVEDALERYLKTIN